MKLFQVKYAGQVFQVIERMIESLQDGWPMLGTAHIDLIHDELWSVVLRRPDETIPTARLWDAFICPVVR